MTAAAHPMATLTTLDDTTRDLVRLSAGVAASDDAVVRQLLSDAARGNVTWIEEVLLQSYLFAGFPRALNAMRVWRRLSGRPAVLAPENDGDVAQWRARGEHTCRQVYGTMYESLRRNILELHPELDEWMIVEGYGKVLSRPGLDLARRELCIVAACAASGQERQLHSHLHGAVNVGVATHVVTESIEALGSLLDEARLVSARLLWARVKGK
jgi:4-carboxymuconolactone decarboxylase